VTRQYRQIHLHLCFATPASWLLILLLFALIFSKSCGVWDCRSSSSLFGLVEELLLQSNGLSLCQ